MEEDIVKLPLKDWWYALGYAGRFEMENRRYPGPTGKLIREIRLITSRPREFIIFFEDGSLRRFVVGE